MAKNEEGKPTPGNDPARSEVVAADVPKDEKVTDKEQAREEQFPSLVGQPNVEIAERTIDETKASTPTHTKTFVTPKATWGVEDQAEVHKRNINAVRQSMVNQGLRPDADVVFSREYDWPFDDVSVGLDYEVKAVPAAIATDFDTRHTVIPQNGETATSRADADNRRAELQVEHFDQLQKNGSVPAEKDAPKK